MIWNRLHHGDCLRGLAQCKPHSVNLIFADPPFNIDYEYDVKRRTQRPIHSYRKTST